MKAGAKGYFYCKNCDYHLPCNKPPHPKYSAKRSYVKIVQGKGVKSPSWLGLQPPWCVKCHQEMVSRGISWACKPCHSWPRKHMNMKRPPATPIIELDLRPWCVRCQRPMLSLQREAAQSRPEWRCKPAWKCGTCFRTCVQFVTNSEKNRRDEQILTLLKRGVPHRDIIKIAHCGPHTVCRLSKQLIGRPEKRLKLEKSFFDRIPFRIGRSIPWSVPAEMRDDLEQEAILAIMRAVDDEIAKHKERIRRYNQTYNDVKHIQIDADPYYWQNELVG